MKSKILILCFATIILAAGAFCAWQKIYRARHDLVTLSVRNAPVADVIRAISSQTREPIYLGPGVTGTVTLHANNTALSSVLDQIADQVNAQPQTYHAVYQSKYSLQTLASALASGRDYQDLGWTNLSGAPEPTVVTTTPENLPDLVSNSSSQSHSLTLTITNGDLSSPEAQRQIDRQLAAMPAALRPMIRAKLEEAMAGALKNVSTNSAPVFKTIDNAGNVTISGGDPLLLEAGLITQFNALAPTNHESPDAPTLAKALNCKSATLYVLQPSTSENLMGHHLMRQLFTTASTNGEPLPPLQTNLSDQLSTFVQRDKADEMMNLSPEDRVIRARHHETKTNN